MILPVTIIVYPPPNSLHEMLLSKLLHLISCYLTQDDTVFSIECLVIRFEWFLFFHLDEFFSSTDHIVADCSSERELCFVMSG